MDLLFKRYASPFLFLDSLMELGILKEGLDNLIEQDAEETMWELYLHSMPSKSFNDWKEEVFKRNKEHDGLSESEVITQVNEAEAILRSFRKKGGNK